MLVVRNAKFGKAIAAVAATLGLVSLGFAARADAFIYWTNDNGTIGRANIDGTNPNQAFVTGLADPFGVAVDYQHVYWADEDQDSIGRANLDGTNVQEQFITGASSPRGIAVSASPNSRLCSKQ